MKLDLGCGPKKQDGFEGVDIADFGRTDHIVDLRKRWPWPDDSVTEARSSHFIEHLNASERIFFFNELHRVLQLGAKCTLIVPHWSHDSYYGDPTHLWPPISEWMLFYLNREWRDANAPHCGYTCNFEFEYEFNINPHFADRPRDWLTEAAQRSRNIIQELRATLTKA